MKKLFYSLHLIVLSMFFSITAKAKVDTVLVADFSFTPSNLTLCLGDTIRFVWVSGIHNVHIVSPIDSTSPDLTMNGGMFEFVAPFPGLYNYQCDYHAVTMSGTFAVDVTPSTNLGSDVTFCGSGVLDAGYAGLNYLWSTGETTQTISVSSSGTYYVTISDACGSSSDTINVTVYPNPVISPIPNPTICAGTSVTLSASGGVNYLWLPGNQTTQSIVITPLGTSVYTVIVTDVNGCSASSTVTVNVTYNFSVSITPTDASCMTCADGSATSVIMGGTPPFTYLWLPSGQTSSVATGLLPGTYTLCVMDGSGCMDCEITFIAPVCDTAITTFAGGNRQDGNMFDVVAKNGLIITGFECNIANDSDGVAVIQIFYKTGSYVGSETDPSAWTLLGTDTVTGVAPTGTPTLLNVPINIPVVAWQTVAFYITISANTTIDNLEYTNGPAKGNIAAENSDILILQGIGKQYPFGATFPATGNGSRIFNGIVHYCLSPMLNAEDVEVGNDVLAYPNPTHDFFIIMSKIKPSQVNVYNIMGEKAMAIVTTDERMVIDISWLHSGMYFVEVKSASGNTIKKIVKE